jgi:hypothetical protein
MIREKFDNGKYEVIFDNGKLHALRHGEAWRDLVGDGMVLAMLYEVKRLRDDVRKAGVPCNHDFVDMSDQGGPHTPTCAHCGSARDAATLPPKQRTMQEVINRRVDCTFPGYDSSAPAPDPATQLGLLKQANMQTVKEQLELCLDISYKVDEPLMDRLQSIRENIRYVIKSLG